MADSVQEERLQNYLEAEKKALKSQEYAVGSERNRRPDLDKIGQGINELLGATGTPRAKRVIFRDW